MAPNSDFEAPFYNLNPFNEISSENLSTPSSFENIKTNLFPVNTISDEAYDPDTNFFNDKLDDLDSPYYTQDELIQYSSKLADKTFSIFHLNIRSLSKNIDNLQNLVSILKGHFKVIVLTETWCRDTASKNSLLQIPNYTVIHTTRGDDKQGGGVCMFVRNDLNFKLRNDLDRFDSDIETLSIEIENRNSKNIIITGIYRPPRGNINTFQEHSKTIMSKNSLANKHVFLIGDFNINSLDYSSNEHVKQFFDTSFQKNFVPLINRPTRVTRNSATCIDHILTNSFIDTNIESGIFKSDMSDHFSVFCNIKTIVSTDSDKTIIHKRKINDDTIDDFKYLLQHVNWDDIISNSTKESYDNFINKFRELYDVAFPEIEIEIKTKNLQNPWFTKGLAKSSKRKQDLYEKFLKKRNLETETAYKTYKSLFEKLKKNAKRLYYQNKLKNCEGNIKSMRKIMKEIVGKSKIKQTNFPKCLLINKKEITDKMEIANKFNEFFANIGPNLAAKIPEVNKNFKSYIPEINTSLIYSELTEDEFESAFKSLKKDKAPGYDKIHINVVMSVYDEIKNPFFRISKNSVRQGIVPDNTKIAKILPTFKTGKKELLTNYRPISVLPCFSKILERIMYNRLYNYLDQNNLLYSKQFGFRSGHSTDHPLIDLVDSIYRSFNESKYTLGVFIDLSKAFDTVDHDILLSKLELYGVRGNHLEWFKSYLSNRQQYVEVEGKKTGYLGIKCGVPQGSILGPLLFLIYVNDLYISSKVLEPIMFADDTNLFFSHKNIKELFRIVNFELEKICTWFKVNKLSLNEGKTKYTLFHKSTDKDNIPLKLPKLTMNEKEISRTNCIKFLGVLFDENLTWKSHINLIENKIAKNIGILYKARYTVNQCGLRSLYYSFIHSYLNYGNIVWASTNRTKLKRLASKQREAIRIIDGNINETIFEKMQKFKILNIHKINIYQVLNFMFRVKNNTIPNVFNKKFKLINHIYPTRNSQNNFVLSMIKYKQTKNAISVRGPSLWNNVLKENQKIITSEPLFKGKLKDLLLSLENEIQYF